MMPLLEPAGERQSVRPSEEAKPADSTGPILLTRLALSASSSSLTSASHFRARSVASSYARPNTTWAVSLDALRTGVAEEAKYACSALAQCSWKLFMEVHAPR